MGLGRFTQHGWGGCLHPTFDVDNQPTDVDNWYMDKEDLIRAIAKEDLHDLLTPLAVVVALEIANNVWTEELTKRYGTEIERVIKSLKGPVRR